jgi:hypothetical protein
MKVIAMHRIISCILASAWTISLAVSQAWAVAPVANDYFSNPPLMEGSSKPAILIVLSKDMDMFAPAYAAPTDVDNDGRMDFGFNPATVYTGIFDPYSCYTYIISDSDPSLLSDSALEKAKVYEAVYNPKKRGRFTRLGPTVPGKPDAAGQYPDANRLHSAIKYGFDGNNVGREYFPAPRAAAGICPASHTVSVGEDLDNHGKNKTSGAVHAEARMWTGNWLNFMTSSRIDVVRQVLYGGKRVLDNIGETMLTVEWIPENASVWTYDDFTPFYWIDYSEGMKYYYAFDHLPVDPQRMLHSSNELIKPRYRRLNSYGRFQNRLGIIDVLWFMRQREEVTNHEGFRSFSGYQLSKYRNQTTPLIYMLNTWAENNKTNDWEVVVEACRKLSRKEVFNFYARINTARTGTWAKPSKEANVAEKDLLEAGDYCQQYGSYYKPVGILQSYTELDQALFGLLTGVFNDQNRWDGGILRQNVKSIKNQIDEHGRFVGTSANNIFKMLDAIVQVTYPRLSPLLGEDRSKVDTDAQKKRRGWADPKPSAFGNPIGEMFYASLLYFAHSSQSGYNYWPDFLQNVEDITQPDYSTPNLPRLGMTSGTQWQSPLFANEGDCLNPVILLLSSTKTSHDGDLLPGTPHGQSEGATSPPVLNLRSTTTRTSQAFNMNSILADITTQENLGGKSYYIANVNHGAGATLEGGVSRQEAGPGDSNLCAPKVLNNLADVRGLCPGAPQEYGTYAVAAAAYYGNTHGFDYAGNQVQTYVVALPTIFPQINLEARGKVISISPIAMSVTKPCGKNEFDSRFCKDGTLAPSGITFLGPTAVNVIQWRADKDGRLYSGAVYAGYNGRPEAAGPDYQVDAPVRYYFDLVRECVQTTESCYDPANPTDLYYTYRYDNINAGEDGDPTSSEARKVTVQFFNQPKYYNDPRYASLYSPGRVFDHTCKYSNYRAKISGCGGGNERKLANAILQNFQDGRYAAAPFKRHREWVYKNWDHAGRPNYIFGIERPRNYDEAVNRPQHWAQLPAYYLRAKTIIANDWYPDPTLMQEYSRRIFYKSASGKCSYTSPDECSTRTDSMRPITGGANVYTVTSGGTIASGFNDDPDRWDYVLDESKSMFIDRPFVEVGYSDVMDVYGQIGAPGRIYKRIQEPGDIDKAVGVVVFMYSLYEDIDLSDRSMSINIGYYMHGGVNYSHAQGDPARSLGDAEGTYIEIQNEHNYMGGSSQKVVNEGVGAKQTTGEEFGLMGIAHPLNTPPNCYRAGRARFTEPMNFLAAEDSPLTFIEGTFTSGLKMPGYLSDTDQTPHGSAIPDCGSARLPLTSTRFFRFPDSEPTTKPNYLPDPLWLAAKYGGFRDLNENGKPDLKAEWDIYPEPDGDGIPDNYFYANNLTELKPKLVEAFRLIMARVNVGTATSASVNSVLGGGITVRTYYQSSYKPAGAQHENDPKVSWLGGTYALFIDLWGNMREDTNGNGKLDLDADKIVVFVGCPVDDDECNNLRDTFDIKTLARRYPVIASNIPDTTREELVSLAHIKTVWNLSQNLSKADDSTIITPRGAISPGNNQRMIYFHQDGLTENLPTGFLGTANLFKPDRAAQLAKYLLQPTEAQAKKLIEFVMGKDDPSLRSRKAKSPWPDDANRTITCRLGDVINSQPIILGAPFSNYDNLYGDVSYAEHRNAFSKRRNLALVGANDGMLHAVNMGRHISYSEGLNGYDDMEGESGAMGREMWAFIPQAILPHLQWLALAEYGHSYYLDLTPTVVEVKDGEEWRTLVLGSLRFGGRAIEMGNNQYSYSEVFALDVTDTDQPPKILWRFSHPQMGLVVSRPTVVRNDAGGDDNWFAIVGSGPTYDNYDAVRNVTVPAGFDGAIAYNGHSNQSARFFAFDAIRGPSSGVYTVNSGVPNSFISQFQVLRPFSANRTEQGVSWTNPVAYFSLNQSAPDNGLLCETSDNCDESGYDNSGFMDKGGVWRLNMVTPAGAGIPVQDWANNFKVFYNAKRPISAAVNTTYDAEGNLWVIFGSGRFWSLEDSKICDGTSKLKECRLNHVNYLYGIKEPVGSDGKLTFGTVSDASLYDVSNVVVYENSAKIRAITEETDTTLQFGDLKDGNDTVQSYDDLAWRIAHNHMGYKRALKTDSENYSNGDEINNPGAEEYEDTDWWSGLSAEMIVDQIAVAPYGNNLSVMSFSSFLPLSAVCGSTGRSYGYLLDTFTGLPRPEFGSSGFNEINMFAQRSFKEGTDIEGVVSGHISEVQGKSAASVYVVVGTNDSKMAQFEIVNSDGKVDTLKLPQKDTQSGGVVSWREVVTFDDISD